MPHKDKQRRSAYNRDYREKNKEELKEKDYIYYQRNRNSILEKKKSYHKKNRETILARQKIWRDTHKDQRKVAAELYIRNNREKMKRYDRNSSITNRGKRIYGVIKRPYEGYCELCGRVVGEEIRDLDYHHWDDNDIVPGKKIKGIWVCWQCHQLCELVDKKQIHLVQRYLRFKRALNKREKIQEKIKPELN